MMKRISLDEVMKRHNIDEAGNGNLSPADCRPYVEIYDYIIKLINSNELKPIKSSGTNGKKPALYNAYWIEQDGGRVTEEQRAFYINELKYQISPTINNDYYLSHINQYEADRKWVLQLDSFLKNQSYRIGYPASVNERSFEIWRREKFLQREQGRKILKKCGIHMDDLNVYETFEPLAYYMHNRDVPQQHVVIVENKDTYYSMRRFLSYGNACILGVAIGTLIYGAGKGILRSCKDFPNCIEPYIQARLNRILYFGDLDYEGIGIYENLAASMEKDSSITIKPFVEAYEAMLKNAMTHTDDVYKNISHVDTRQKDMTQKSMLCDFENVIGNIELPKTKELQNRNISGLFFSHFTKESVEVMKGILERGLYIPQEILTITDF